MKKLIGLLLSVLLLATPAMAQSQRPGQKPTSSPPISVKPSSSVRPGGSTGQSSGPSAKPKSDFHSDAIDAKKRADARIAHQQATAPPAPAFKSPSGHNVAIDPDSYHTKTVRSLPRTEVVQHQSRVDVYHHQRYGPRWDYYSSRPVVVIGHYSSPFWYSTYDWDVHRQAMWMYHNQFVIPPNLWADRLASNIILAAEINRLANQGISRNPNYIDTEYVGNPEYMYSSAYVNNAYGTTSTPVVVDSGPVVYSSGGGHVVWISLGSIVGILLVVFFVWLIFFKDAE